MKLRVSLEREPKNTDVVRRVLEGEFGGENLVELSREAGVAFLIWRSALNDGSDSVSVGMPMDWLMDPQHAASVEDTTRNFAGYVLKAATT